MRRGPECARSVDWLEKAGVWVPGDSHSANMGRCEAYRASVGRLGAPPGKAWAKDILSRYRAGERLHDYAVKLAMAALDVKEPVIHPPKRAAPRPDARDRQANDVEHEVRF